MGHLETSGIDHVNMNIKNLEESVDFYTNLFGLELKKDQSDQNSKIIGNDIVKLCLYENPEGVQIKGINHVGFHIGNFDEVVSKCKSMGIQMPYGVTEWESSRSVYIIDPNGYEVELSEVFGGGL
jgi:catechol 2,3-dioxygenase-like lactoylglutathione lyase family enzyme